MKKKWLIALTSSSSAAFLAALSVSVFVAITALTPASQASQDAGLAAQDINASAPRNQFLVKVRDGKALKESTVTLKDLESDRAFDGKYFKIVEGTSDEPISFQADPALVLRAATAYHHLTIAKDYFTSLKQDPEFFKHLERKTTIRVGISVPWSDTDHFVSNGQTEYNNARTVPASGRMRMPDVAAWGPEIWFYEGKEIRRQSTTAAVSQALSSQAFSNVLLEQLIFTDVNSMTQAITQHQFVWQEHLATLAVSVGLAELLPKFLALSTSWIKQTYFIDTVLIPEVIYHEYGHLAFGDQLGLVRSTQILEGYPNFFAYKISGLKNLAARTGKASKGFSGKNGKSKALYSFDQEQAAQAALGSFMFSLLVDLDEAFGEESLPILIRAVQYLDGSSDLKHEFQNALFTAIDEVGSDPEALKLVALGVLIKKGF